MSDQIQVSHCLLPRLLRSRAATWASVSKMPCSAACFSSAVRCCLNEARLLRSQMERTPDGETKMRPLAQFVAGSDLAVGGLLNGVGENSRFCGFCHPILWVRFTPVAIEQGFDATFASSNRSNTHLVHHLVHLCTSSPDRKSVV